METFGEMIPSGKIACQYLGYPLLIFRQRKKVLALAKDPGDYGNSS